jgi:cobalt-zinc-cadmium resistance protein CzcA
MSGVAVLDDMILVSYVRHLRERGASLDDAVTGAAITRLRPVLMTTLVASLGFLPMAFSTGMGAEVQRPLATVVIGGVIGAMIMSLLVLRVLYLLFSTVFERPQSREAEFAGSQALLGNSGAPGSEAPLRVSATTPGEY